ncbi:unnamed protein product [Bursaphelenchus xylophilus]|uniref:(pine wood nematode) hypothetical protein n=1 Tax=Bursaphelenchus xylophilus TaxID=6326 RepID=A0A1I7SAM6_BURXY|nr:unnamed protein product [Bursaphelenchus xylophilus]CAG9079164.1 unnamed protein product [Bursaphelenchus xylophilus]
MKPKIRFLPLFVAFLTTFLSVDGSVTQSSRLSSVFKHQCPESCLCVPDVLDVELLIISCKWPTIQSGYLEKFPKNATKSLSIHCSDNGRPSKLPDGSFDGFSELKELRISSCKFDSLSSGSFAGLQSLKNLHISEFGDPQWNSDVFHEIRSIDKLSLVDGGIKNLPDGMLCVLRNLQILSVSGNQLSDIKLGLNEDCLLEHLILLDVSKNRIRQIDSKDLVAFPVIRQLSATRNGLDEIAADAFLPTKLLQHLDLEGNLIRALPALPDSLLYLNLADNRLETIPVTVANLENLVSLNFSRNEIDMRTPFQLFSQVIEILDFSYNRFNTLPTAVFERSVDTLKTLILVGNEISTLEIGGFGNYSRLQMLDLSNNRLKSLSEGVFEGLNELIELKLVNNTIYHVDVEAFKPLADKLQYLDMGQNKLTELPMAVGRLKSARHLDFDSNLIRKTYKFILNKVSHLSKLSLANNQLNSIESYVFSDCAKLNELNLRNNKIDLLNVDAFNKSPLLRTLDLSNNELTELRGSLKSLKSLRHLNLTSNLFSLLDWNEFPENLVQLQMSDNRVALLAAATKSKVRKLELQNNEITVLLTEQLPDELEFLNISSNRISTLNNSTFSRQPHLKQVDLRRNLLKSFNQQTFPLNSGLLKLFLSQNPLECNCETGWWRAAEPKSSSAVQLMDYKQIECTVQANKQLKSLSATKQDDFVCAYEEICEPNCVCCQFSSCDCKSKCPKGCNCYHDADFRTNIVHCDANKTKEVPFEIRELPMHATHIRLNGLKLHMLKSRDLTGRAHLQELRINNTGLKEVQPMAFNTLPSLKTLSLTHGHLHKLDAKIAVKTARLQHLDLSHNHLNHLSAELLETFPNLKDILLHSNSFSSMPELVLKVVPEKLRTLALGANPFRCDCVGDESVFNAQNFVASNVGKIVDVETVLCVENVTRAFRFNETFALSSQAPNVGEDLFVMKMVDFLRQANTTMCRRRNNGLFGGGALYSLFLVVIAVFFVITALCGLLYLAIAVLRKTQEGLKQHRYKKAPMSMNSSTLTPNGGFSPQPLINFDLFISYSKRDEQFVKERLCNTLHAHDYSMCLLHDDTPPECYSNRHQRISDELNKQMGASQTLILVLTKDFLENEWSTLQIKTSHQLFSARKSERKVIVLLDEAIDTNSVDNELGQIMRHNTCIPLHHQLFWNLLLGALPRRDYGSGDGIYADNNSETTQIYSDMYGTIVPSEIV